MKTEFHEEARDLISEAGNTVLNALEEVLVDPTVKKGFSLLGKLGGDAKAENLLVDSMATDMLDSPQFAAIRMGASTLGFDLDEYIEKHGAVKTLTAANQLGKMLGIDITNIDIGKLLQGGSLSQPAGGNPYLNGGR